MALENIKEIVFHKSGLIYFVKMMQLKNKNLVIFNELLHYHGQGSVKIKTILADMLLG